MKIGPTELQFSSSKSISNVQGLNHKKKLWMLLIFKIPFAGFRSIKDARHWLSCCDGILTSNFCFSAPYWDPRDVKKDDTKKLAWIFILKGYPESVLEKKINSPDTSHQLPHLYNLTKKKNLKFMNRWVVTPLKLFSFYICTYLQRFIHLGRRTFLKVFFKSYYLGRPSTGFEKFLLV